MAVNITATCPYCHFGPIHSLEFLKVCAHCGTIYLKEARFCTGCGRPTDRLKRESPWTSVERSTQFHQNTLNS